MNKKIKIVISALLVSLTVLLTVTTLLALKSSNVKMINHRGYSIEAPENTLAAFKLSVKKGYKYVECDVDFTKDGIPVLIHDSTVDRTSNVKTGENIRDITFEKARTYDFGYPDKFGDKYKGEKIPSFEEFLDLCVENDLYPYVEVKTQSGKYAYTNEQINLIVELVGEKGLINKTTFISFNYDVLSRIKDIDGGFRLGYLRSKVDENDVNKTQLLKTEFNSVFLNVNFGYLTSSVVNLVKRNEIPLEVWTVNYDGVAKTLNTYVSGITTDCLLYH